MVRSCRDSGIHVAVDTCGHADTAPLLDVARDADLFLFDLKMMDEDRHRAYTGASNARILENLERLVAVHSNVVIRFPLIPGVNDDDENVRATGAYLASLRLTRVDVLPYHRAGIAKYDRLQRPYLLSGHPAARRRPADARRAPAGGLRVDRPTRRIVMTERVARLRQAEPGPDSPRCRANAPS